MCATLNRQFNRYFSQVSYQSAGQELVSSLRSMLRASLQAFHHANSRYPSNLIIFRDGVSEEQLKAVVCIVYHMVLDVCEITAEFPKQQMDELFAELGITQPIGVCIVVVQKRVHARFSVQRGMFLSVFYPLIFLIGSLSNPAPGTVIDSAVTSDRFADFYIVAQHVNQGNAIP